jgi:aspartate/glutamate racemase
LAGTDLNLIFNEANAGFPAIDCAAAHITAIVEEMCSGSGPTAESGISELPS